MKWDSDCYLLDLKPQANAASLFLCCSGNRDTTTAQSVQLSVRKHSIEVQQQFQPHEHLMAMLADVDLQPESISNCSWVDGNTFQCKVTVECLVSDLDAVTNSELIEAISGPLSVKKFCDSCREFPPVIQCAMCHANLLTENSKLSRWYQLPSDGWEDSVGEWFCHSHEHESHHDECGKYRNQDLTNSLLPTPECGFVNESYVLLHPDVLKGVAVDEQNLVVCKRCNAELGCFHRKGLQMTESRQLYHCCVNVSPKSQNDTALSASATSKTNFLFERFGSMDRYFAWLLLSNSEAHSSLKFAIKTLDNKPKLLVWLLDSYSIFITGKLKAKNGSPPSAAKSYPVIKVLYKVFDEGSASDPRANGYDWSVSTIHLPSRCSMEFTETLLSSTEALPQAYRRVGQFYVGFLKLDL